MGLCKVGVGSEVHIPVSVQGESRLPERKLNNLDVWGSWCTWAFGLGCFIHC